MLRSLAAASVLACLGFQAGHAQDLQAICRRAFHPTEGAWSEFRIVGGQGDGATIRMSVVGSETRAGTQYYWLETAERGMGMGGASRAGAPQVMIDKMLVRGFGPDAEDPVANVMKLGDAPAMQMPVERSRHQDTPGSSTLDRCAQGKIVGWESVTVPGGTFHALHVRDAGGGSDYWVVPDLPFAMVKMVNEDSTRGREMVLVGHGLHATSQITETPHPWDPRLFMQMMQQQRGQH